MKRVRMIEIQEETRKGNELLKVLSSGLKKSILIFFFIGIKASREIEGN